MADSLNIVIAGPAWPYRGGIATFNERLAAQFNSDGHNCKIITFRLQYPSLLFPGKTQYSGGAAPEGIAVKRLINSINPFNWLLTGLKIKRERPDILLVRYWTPFLAPALGTIARIAGGNGHTRVVALFDNVIPHERHFFDNVLTRFFARSVKAAVTMTDSVTSDLRRFNDRIPVLTTPHPLFDNYGTDPGRSVSASSLGLDEGKRYILFFGFIRRYKGLDLLLEAFSLTGIRESGNVKLIVAGEFYDDEALCKGIIEERGMENDIVLIDRFIADEEVPCLFSVADIVVQPYRTATQSGVTQIAYHYRKPMIVTEAGGLSEMVPHNRCGFVVKPEPEDIASAIDIFFSGDYKERFADGIERQRALYDWHRMTSAIIKLSRGIDGDSKTA